jgi:tyrosine-protein phosphatase SIW14
MRMSIVPAALVAAIVAGSIDGQVTKITVPGVTNFARIETTIACAGATTPAGVAELKKLGYAAIINLRQETEAGADIDAGAAAAKEAGLRFVHLPLNGAAPDPAVVDRFLDAVVDPANQPVFVHCASGNRAAMVWMIKRMVVDRWDADRASAEATALGLTSPALTKFALDYAAAHKR